MEKCGIADESDYRPVQHLAESSRRGHAGTHADEEIGHFERWKNAQGVASDVGGVDRFLAKYLLHRDNRSPGGGSRDKDWAASAAAQALRRLLAARNRIAEKLADCAFYLYRIKLESLRNQSLAFACNFDRAALIPGRRSLPPPQGKALLPPPPGPFLRRQKFGDQGFGLRIGKAQLQNLDFILQAHAGYGVQHVEKRDAAGNDAQIALSGNKIKRAAFGLLVAALWPLSSKANRNFRPTAGITTRLKGSFLNSPRKALYWWNRADLYRPPAMVYPRCGAQKAGRTEFFGNPEGFKRHPVSFLRSRWLEHRDSGKPCIVSAILFVLAGMKRMDRRLRRSPCRLLRPRTQES